MRLRSININLGLGLFVIALALFALIFWVPSDTVSGLMLFKRGRYSIGDAMAPSLAFALMALSGLLIVLKARIPQDISQLKLGNLGFLSLILGVCIVALLTMTYGGPWAVDIFGNREDSYRSLRDSAPWKHIGFAIGGIILVSGLIGLVEHKLTINGFIIGLGTVLVLIGIFDLAFDNLLLPPNGDQ